LEVLASFSAESKDVARCKHLQKLILNIENPFFLVSLQRSCLGFLWACLNLSRSFLQSKIAKKRESS
jgi:hypothetical protein